MLARLGEHIAVAMNARVNVIPVRRRSASWGMSASSQAGSAGQCCGARCWSVTSRMRLGGRSPDVTAPTRAVTSPEPGPARQGAHGERRRRAADVDPCLEAAPRRPADRRERRRVGPGEDLPARDRRGAVPAGVDGDARRAGAASHGVGARPGRRAPGVAQDPVAAVVLGQAGVEHEAAPGRELREERLRAPPDEDVAAGQLLEAALALGRGAARPLVLAHDPGRAPAVVEREDQPTRRPPSGAGRPRRRTG